MNIGGGYQPPVAVGQPAATLGPVPAQPQQAYAGLAAILHAILGSNPGGPMMQQQQHVVAPQLAGQENYTPVGPNGGWGAVSAGTPAPPAVPVPAVRNVVQQLQVGRVPVVFRGHTMYVSPSDFQHPVLQYLGRH